VRASGLTDHEHRREEAAAPALGAYHSTGELAAYDEADEPKRQGDTHICSDAMTICSDHFGAGVAPAIFRDIFDISVQRLLAWYERVPMIPQS
jgi:hypothetical protein